MHLVFSQRSLGKYRCLGKMGRGPREDFYLRLVEPTCQSHQKNCNCKEISPSPHYFVNKVVPGWQDLTPFPPHIICMKCPSPSLDGFCLPGHIRCPLLPLCMFEQADGSKRSFIASLLPHLSPPLATLSVGLFLAEDISPCSLLKEKEQKQDAV